MGIIAYIKHYNRLQITTDNNRQLYVTMRNYI